MTQVTATRGCVSGVWQALYAFSPLIWLYAIGAEVFSLNNLFAAATVYQTILISQSPAPARHKRILLGAFVSGLAMTNQHTIVLYQVPLIAWILWTNRAVRGRG